MLVEGRDALRARASVVLVVAVAFPLPISEPQNISAQITLREVTGPPERSVHADVKLTPPDAAEDAEWFVATSWQGKGSIVADL